MTFPPDIGDIAQYSIETSKGIVPRAEDKFIKSTFYT